MALIRSLIFFGFTALFFSCAAQHQVVEGKKLITQNEEYNFYLFIPESYHVEKDDFPLLLFLHGGGESGRNLSVLKKHGPPKMMAEGYPFPFLVLAPQHPNENTWWDVRAVKELLELVVEEYRVDRDRLYLTGLSRGGSAAWELAVNYPDTFAAMAVVCGMAPTPYAHWLNKEMPIWVFHGAEDPVIPVSESDIMVNRLKELGYNVTYTRYDGVGHDSWIPAYKNDDLYTWFTRYRKN